MEKRTFDKIIEEKVEKAEYVVESAKEYNVVIPGLSEMKEVLKDPVEAVKEEVVDLANLAASVHEIGLPTEDPAVERFAKEKLGMQPSEFGEIINDRYHQYTKKGTHKSPAKRTHTKDQYTYCDQLFT